MISLIRKRCVYIFAIFGVFSIIMSIISVPFRNHAKKVLERKYEIAKSILSKTDFDGCKTGFIVFREDKSKYRKTRKPLTNEVLEKGAFVFENASSIYSVSWICINESEITINFIDDES